MTAIGFTYWFFLMKKEEDMVVAGDSIDITVDGGYHPSVISITKGKTTKIHITRKDPSPCLEEVVLADFKIRQYLPLHKTVTIELTPQHVGEFQFSCGMHMFHGKVRVM
ncbi:MAG: cupredoxin domain-containing protein [Candidatus Roizmanbacteria bacterium]|nr:cupredoxin domain-containing protein [Candidatus Roizmanbacteria bacterium]